MEISNPSRFASAFACASMSNHASLANRTFPSGMPVGTSKMYAPPTPARAIASRSAVMPSLVTFPFIQCHHTCDRADGGGRTKPLRSASDAISAVVEKKTTRTTWNNLCFILLMLQSFTSSVPRSRRPSSRRVRGGTACRNGGRDQDARKGTPARRRPPHGNS